MGEKLEIEEKYYMDHVSEWIKANQFKFVLIKNEELIGFFDSIQEAFKKGLDSFGLDDFFIKQIMPIASTNISFLGQVY